MGKTKEAIPIIALCSQPTERSEENGNNIIHISLQWKQVTSNLVLAIADCSTVMKETLYLYGGR